MSRWLRVVLLALGGIVTFGVFAVAGFALADRFAADSPAAESQAVDGVATVTLSEYPLQPAEDDTAAQFEYLNDELERTALAVESEGEIGVGTASVGGQVTRSIIGDPAPEDGSATTIDPGDAEGSTPTVVPGDGDGSAATFPEPVGDTLRRLGELGLVDPLVADPVGPLLIDVCAGPERLPETPAGCPLGFGGSIFTSDETIDPAIQAAVFRTSSCDVSDPDRLGLVVRASEPGTLDLTLWPGEIDSEPTPDAFVSTFEVPPDVASEYVDGMSSLPAFCIEVPAMAGNLVAEHFLISGYPARVGMRGPTNRDRIANQSGRPPTILGRIGATDFGVRTISSPDETVWVKARELDFDLDVERACNTGGATTSSGPRGPYPGGETEADVVGFAPPGYPHPANPYPDDWPYDPRYNVYGIYSMNLRPASSYAICTYFVGPFDEIVQSEAALVTTSSFHGVDVRVVGVAGNGREAGSDVRGHTAIIQGCGTTNIRYPGPNTVIQHDYACEIEDLTRLMREDGFWITIRTTDGIQDHDTQAWVRVDGDDVLCVTTCETASNWVTAIPIEGFQPTASGRRNEQIATLQLEVVLTATQNGPSDWYIGTSDAFDNTNPELPPNPRVGLAHLGTPVNQVGERVDASVDLEVVADRPVDITVEVDSGYPTCPVDASTAPATSAAVSFVGTPQRIRLTGLCFGVTYPVTVEATDSAGASTRRVSFVTTETSAAIILDARVQLEPLPRLTNGYRWHQRFRGVEIGNRSELSGGGTLGFDSIPMLGPTVSTADENGSRWEVVGSNVTCDGDTTPPAPRRWRKQNVPLRSFGYSVDATVTRSRYLTASDLGLCEPSRNNPDAPPNIELVEHVRWNVRDLSLQQLLNGVEIATTTDYGVATLILQAELDPGRR